MQALLKKEEEWALYVHCLARNINLCLQRTTQQCEIIRNVMDFFISFTPAYYIFTWVYCPFNTICNQAALDKGEITPSLKSACLTSSTVRNGAINSILENYHALISTLDEVRVGHDEYAAKAYSGLQIKMKTFEISFGLKIAHLIFSSLEQLSTYLQSKVMLVFDATQGDVIIFKKLFFWNVNFNFENKIVSSV